MTIQPLERNRPTPTRDETPLTVRARSTCAGAHVHVGSLRMQREDLPAFADRYQERQDASVLAALTASAVNDIQGTLAPRLGARVYSVVATASAGSEQDGDIALELFLESPDAEPALREVAEAWQQEFATALLPAGTALSITVRAVDWYATN